MACDASDGKCPIYALENSGNTINGYLIQQVVNSTAPVAGRKKVRALAKKEVGASSVETRALAEEGLKRIKEQKRVKHKHF